MIGANRVPGSADANSAEVTGPNEVYLVGPGVLSSQVEALLAKGIKASRIERYAVRRLGETSMTAAVIAGAAHHLERQR